MVGNVEQVVRMNDEDAILGLLEEVAPLHSVHSSHPSLLNQGAAGATCAAMACLQTPKVFVDLCLRARCTQT